MFYDRLLNLKSLKTRLLSSSSFALLYSSDEKLPLAKFRREGISLTPLIAGLLAACGGFTKYVPVGDVLITSGDGSGGDGSGDSGTTPFGASDFTVTVADGLIEGALVYIDTNNNGTFDAGDSTGSDDRFILRYHEIADGSGEYDVVADFTGSEVLDTAGTVQLASDPYFIILFDADKSILQNFATFATSTLIRWEQKDASDLLTAAGSTTNDDNGKVIQDTVIYHGNHTNDTTDDWVLMVLEDYTAPLAVTNFDVV